MLEDIIDRRLVFVTGKGGVGKTTVTLATALAAARAGRRVLIVEVNPYGRIGEYLGDVTLGPEPIDVRPNLQAARIVPTTILEEFVLGILRIRALAHRLLESQTFRVLMAAAPGIEEFLTLVKIAEWEEARTGRGRRRHRFDLILVDAPATGHSVPLLATPDAMLKILPFGLLATRARDLALRLNDARRTAVAIVTRPEAMAVNETLELATALMQIGVAVLPAIVNGVPPVRFSPEESRRLGADPADVPVALLPYVAAGRFALARQRTAARQVSRLRRSFGGRPLQLPQVPTARFDLASIDTLAAALGAHP